MIAASKSLHELALRPYQIDVIARVESEVAAGRRRVLLVAPTGAGKTVIAGKVVADAVSRNERVLFLAHRRELITQASTKLHAVGVDHGIIQAGFPARPGARVQVASIQTLYARAVRSSRIELPPADLIVLDEAHHCRAGSYQKLLAAYPDAVILGMTATPCRGDGRGLGNAFGAMVLAPSVAELRDMGFLVPAIYYAPTRPDLKGVHVRRGDYVESELAERMNKAKLVGDIVSHWHRLNPDRRRTVVFATGVKHSVHLRDQFRESGVLAEHIDGTTPADERDDILARLKSGVVEAVCNAMVLTEGWDCPAASCLVLARPTKSLGLYLQMAGRVLRPVEGKTNALILDHAGGVFDHGFVDDPIEWTLSADDRAANTAQAARGKGQKPGLAECPECKAIKMQGQPCVVCGWQPRTKARGVKVADGELGQVERDRSVMGKTYSPAERQAFHGKLLWIARERGYKNGWAGHKYKEKFGTWPASRFIDPLPPDAETRAWVKSRQIAWAKSQQAAAA